MLNGQSDLNNVLELDLSSEQWAAIGSELGPTVIVAGAGSGKTTSMAARVAWLVGSQQVTPERILGLTFTTKATGELLTRIRGALNAVYESSDDTDHIDPVVQSYHAFAAHIVREHGIRIGREPSAEVLSEAARASMAYRLVCTTDLPLETLDLSPNGITERLLHLDDALVELDITTEELRAFDIRLAADLEQTPKQIAKTKSMIQTARGRAVLCDLVDQWRVVKSERDVMDFADQIRLALQIVRRFPNIARDIRDQFDAVMLDEYQDTSLAQHHLLLTIFGAGHPVTAVGDPCQAIYGWRGASVANIEQFPHHFGVDGPADRYPFTVNRRSGNRILALANLIAEPLRAEHRGVEALAALPAKGQGQVRCALLETQADEIAWIVDDIAEYANASGQQWGDIAVLTSTAENAGELDRALRAHGIPTYVYGVGSLLNHPVVLDIRAHLEVLHEVTANPWLIRILTNPRWAIGPRDLAALGARARTLAGVAGRHRERSVEQALDATATETEPVESISLREALADLGDRDQYSPEAFARFQQLDRNLMSLGRAVSAPVPELIFAILRNTGLDVEINIAHDTSNTVADQRRAIRSFVQLAHEANASLSLGGFLQYLHEAERLDVDITREHVRETDAVQILTMHKAKGLEFRRVYVPFMSNHAFPNGLGVRSWISSMEDVPWDLRQDCPDALRGFPDRVNGPRTKDFEDYRQKLRVLQDLEDRRLAYVALTRAEQSLTVTGHWWGHTQKDIRGPHPIFEEIHTACLEGIGDVITWRTQDEVAAQNPSPAFHPEPVQWPQPQIHADVLQAQALAVRSGHTANLDIPVVAQWHQTAQMLLDEQRVARASIRTVRLPDAISGTMWMRAQTNPAEVAAHLARPMPQAPSRAAERGSQLHAYIEQRFGQQPLIDPFDLPGAADDAIPSDERLLELQAAFEASAFAHRRPIATERAFAVLIAGRVVRGRIDAVFQDGDRYLVVDWKTGTHVEPLQLALYRAAWAQIAGVRQSDVDVAFFLIGPNELISPSDLPELEIGLPH
jgi:DNA helicase II / ATP-dependent DNA helicase PcrA